MTYLAFAPLSPEPEDPLLCRGLPPVEVLHRILRLDPETSTLYWRRRPRDLCMSANAQASFNAMRAGERAGSKNQTICIFGIVHPIDAIIEKMNANSKQ